MSITVIVENDTIKLPLHVPDGTRVEIVLPAQSTALDMSQFRAWLTSSVGMAKGKFTTDQRLQETRGEDCGGE
jgi:hypothetical protein